MGTRCRRLLSASASTRRRPARGKQHNITVCSSRGSGAAGIRPTRSVPLETVAATTASSQFWHEALVVGLFAVVVAARSGRQEVEDALTSRRLYSRLQALPANFRWESESGCVRVGYHMLSAKV